MLGFEECGRYHTGDGGFVRGDLRPYVHWR
jgi:hypothetical protein